MDDQTFRSRIIKLAQKSRKAVRLYTSMGRINSERNMEFSEVQIQEWKEVNTELLKQITYALESQNTRKLVTSIYALRDRFYSEWRNAQSELHRNHKELIFASENGDFIRAATLSRELVSLKARVEGTQAVHHELQDVINQSKVNQPTIELSDDSVVEGNAARKVRKAKIIPLRKIHRS